MAEPTDRMEEVRERLKTEAARGFMVTDGPSVGGQTKTLCHVEAEDLQALLSSEERMREALGMALAWIDAVPLDTPLPGMPGFDRDWVNAVYSRSALEGEG